MSTTITENTVVRIYTIGCNDNGRLTEFTVSLSMPESKARVTPRDDDAAWAEVWKRVEKVMARDKMTGDPTAGTFSREFLRTPKAAA